MTDTTDLPPLPVRHITREDATGAVLWESEEGPYTAEQMHEYARLAVEQERELWDLLNEHGIHLSRNSGRCGGWYGCGPLGDHPGKGATMREAAEACADSIRGGFVNIGERAATEIKHHVSPEDFGIPKELAQKAQYFADYLIAQERERCAQLCASVAWQAVDLADAIRKGAK